MSMTTTKTIETKKQHTKKESTQLKKKKKKNILKHLSTPTHIILKQIYILLNNKKRIIFNLLPNL